ncbi:Glycerol-3-phosphate dehydrogenase [NAD(P)+] [Mesoplasma florum W37]|uniref:Glycerol-3-phosphate dehydrogenase [NAD(P)+] n=1 Tax=Mesoplasma florum TaxID=2151 RepID=A0AAD2JDD2_MESFO|nr:NAD(P)H-dependent glycerol-3-phosphate dehydrogenase [Mesoplasma florum]AGY41273.1 Glycerol-3-phosphate dehydrogenase [NAD(P)+] [Mesoplasma florum W37]AVN59500.1 glycerol-3-phosphate dehydrogenase (NAD(P)(+)) [Mesoplasma florum]AVN65611.1 Glycerol-3-phosphate dehydrogenase [NAD(P)+] [Mesoplasma florum]
MSKKNITIIGTGAYGTALANVLADNDNNVIMYGIVEQQVDDINIYHQNSVFFDNKKINKTIRATNSMAAALENTDILILGVPTAAIRHVVNDIIKYAKKPMDIINTAKGLDEENLGLLSDKIKKYFEGSNVISTYSALYGPSIAIEVVDRQPTAIMIASETIEKAKELCNVFSNEYFYMYPTTDIAGCEISAALKNAIAIGGGILKAYNAGDNAHATLLTLGLNEMYEFGKHFGAKLETFLNFAGLGDLILTASSKKSRNFRLGERIVELNDAKKALESFNLTVEGVETARIAHEIGVKYQISMNFFEIIYNILYNNVKPISLLNNVFRDVKLV